jgi:hypothetical protein
MKLVASETKVMTGVPWFVLPLHTVLYISCGMELTIHLHQVGISPLMNGSGMGEHMCFIFKFSSSPDLQKLLEPFVNKENTFYQSLKSRLLCFLILIMSVPMKHYTQQSFMFSYLFLTHATLPPHLTFPWVYQHNDICSSIKVMKFFVMQLYEASHSHPASYSQPPSTNEIPRSLFPECALTGWRTKCHTILSSH